MIKSLIRNLQFLPALFLTQFTFSQVTQGPDYQDFQKLEREIIFSDDFESDRKTWNLEGKKFTGKISEGKLFITNTHGHNTVNGVLFSSTEMPAIDNSRNFEFQAEMFLLNANRKFNDGGVYWGTSANHL